MYQKLKLLCNILIYFIDKKVTQKFPHHRKLSIYLLSHTSTIISQVPTRSQLLHFVVLCKFLDYKNIFDNWYKT